MKTLLEPPFNLIAGDDIIVAIRARNANGWSPVSVPSDSEAEMHQEPLIMESPAVQSLEDN
jgi:hypothetical protein